MMIAENIGPSDGTANELGISLDEINSVQEVADAALGHPGQTGELINYATKLDEDLMREADASSIAGVGKTSALTIATMENAFVSVLIKLFYANVA